MPRLCIWPAVIPRLPTPARSPISVAFQARAVAKASILSNTGSIDIRGDVDVEADAEDGAGNSAYANAQFVASANAGVHVGFAGSAEIPAIEGDVAVTALADAGGSGNA